MKNKILSKKYLVKILMILFFFCHFHPIKANTPPITLKNFLEQINPNENYEEKLEGGAFGELIKDIKNYILIKSYQLVKYKDWHLNKMPKKNWSYNPNKSEIYSFDLFSNKAKTEFKSFFVEKVEGPSNARIVVIGDLHSWPLNNILNQLQKIGFINENYNIINRERDFVVFLGDYVDKGPNPFYTSSTILKFYNNNIGNIILLRGNHGGFATQYFHEVPIRRNKKNFYEILGSLIYDPYNYDQKNPIEIISNIFNFFSFYREHLPVGFYFGCPNEQGKTNYIQFCHGGLEVGYNAYPFLRSEKKAQDIKVVNRKQFFKKYKPVDASVPENKFDSQLWNMRNQFVDQLKKNNLQTTCNFSGEYWGDEIFIGFIWTFFLTEDFPPNSPCYLLPHRLCHILSENQTEKLLKNYFDPETCEIISIWRGHQHQNDGNINNLMLNKLIKNAGYVKQWKGLLNTLITVPLAGRSGSIEHESFALLELNKNPSKWNVTHYHRHINQNEFESFREPLFS